MDPVQAEQQLRALEAELDVARVRKDIPLFERVLADSFRTTSPAGSVATKADSLADTRAGRLDIRSSKSSDISVRVYGNTAIVSGTADIEARYDGHEISGSYAYTHVYMHLDDRWQVVAAHVSRRVPDWFFAGVVRITKLFGWTRK